MIQHGDIVTQPLFLLFIAVTAMLSIGYFWGRRVNRRLFLSAFNGLADIIGPDDQTFTNIGGLVGYHANFLIKRQSPIAKIDATITLLPRHSLLYLPISMLIMRHDRLFVSIHLKSSLQGEAHLIETKYAAFRGPKISNAERLTREKVRWGPYDFYLYYELAAMRDKLNAFMRTHPDPGVVRHVAMVPGQRKCFVFMIPRQDAVKADFRAVYRWIQTVCAGNA